MDQFFVEVSFPVCEHQNNSRNRGIGEIFSVIQVDKLDAKDESIIRVLGRRSGMSHRKLSTLVNMPISTVHRESMNSCEMCWVV